MPSLSSQSITFTGTGTAVQPLSTCLNMWQVYIPTGGGVLFPKKDITLVDTGVDVNLRGGMMIMIMSEGIINGTTSCTATSFTRAGTVGLYRIVVPVLNINASSNETGSAGALLATIVIIPTIPTLYSFSGTF